MALNLITLEEAAKLLGISEEVLKDLRNRNEINGYRDGSTWKFKSADVERLAEERAFAAADRAAADSAAKEKAASDSDELMELVTEIPDDAESDVVLLSEVELGESDPGTSGTVIGKPGTQSPEESDIRLITREEREASSGSGLRLVPAAEDDPSTPGSDVKLVPAPEDAASAVDDELSLDLDLDADSVADDDFVLDLEADVTAQPADLSEGPGSDISLADDALDLSLDDELSLDDDSFSLSDEASGESLAVEVGPEPSAGESSIDLGAPEGDDDHVLPASASGSDITISPGDSGISLADPSDSGLSLEEPLNLAGAEDEPLELGEEPMFSLADDSDSQEVSAIEADDDFLLTPMEDAADEDSEDSGSQVIALDSDTDLGGSDELFGGTESMLEEEAMPAVGEAASAAPGLAEAGMATGAPAAVAREAPYTVLQIVSLGSCVLFLGLGGMMIADLTLNMWSWDTPYTINSQIMDLILGMIGG